MVDGPYGERLQIESVVGGCLKPAEPVISGEPLAVDTEANTDPAVETGEAVPELPAPLQNQEPQAAPTPERIQVGTNTDFRDVFEKLGFSDD